MVGWRTRNRETRRDVWYHHEWLRQTAMSSATQCTIPDMAGWMLHPAGMYYDRVPFKSNHGSCMHHFAYLRLSSILFTSSSGISPSHPQLYYHRQNPTLTNSSQSLHVMMMSWHRVQHTPSTLFTEYSIPWVQNTPSTAYTEYSIHSIQHPSIILCLLCNLTITWWALHVAAASSVPPYKIDHHQLALHRSAEVNSLCHIPMCVT